MWIDLSVSRWICVVTLAVVMLASASEGMREPAGELRCRRQRGGRGCQAAYWIWVNDNKIPHCVKPTPPWLKNRMNSGDLNCPLVDLDRSVFSLDEEDFDE